MTVKELIEQLKAFGENEEVFISTDEEGNMIKGIDELVVASGEEDVKGNRIQGVIIYPFN